MSRRPFSFGVLARGPHPPAEWAAVARHAERSGYASFLVSDHPGRGRGPFSTLVHAAATSKLRIGTLVLANDFRHPVMVADEAAGLVVLTQGRFELGLGTGWDPKDYQMTGIPLDPPAVRIARLEEAVVVMRGMWADGDFEHHGEHYRVRFEGSVLPEGKAPPPLLVAGSGRRMLTLAGRLADIVSITATAGVGSWGDFWKATADAGADIADRVAWVRKAAGGRSVELNVLVHHVAVTDDREAAAAEIGEETGVEPSRVLASPHVLIGTLAEIEEVLIERRERFGISYVAVPERWMGDLAPVVERLAGS